MSTCFRPRKALRERLVALDRRREVKRSRLLEDLRSDLAPPAANSAALDQLRCWRFGMKRLSRPR